MADQGGQRGDKGEEREQRDGQRVGEAGWVEFKDSGTDNVDDASTARVSVASHEQLDGKEPTPSMPAPPADPASVDPPSSFVNGELLATIYPENASCVWLTPARFNPYSIPQALTSEHLAVSVWELGMYWGLQMPVEDYVTAMELITNDYRFRSYAVCYGRLVAAWLSLSLLVLLAVLYSSPKGGVGVLVFCLAWMLIVAIGVLGCVVIRKQMLVGLRHCVRSANKILTRYHLLAGVEDRGQLSCHKIVVLFVYFRCDECIPHITRLLDTANAIALSSQSPSGSGPACNATAHSLILKYSQNYVKELVQRAIRFPTRPLEGVSEFCPRHCAKSLCLCQYIQKKHFEREPRAWYERWV